MSECPHGHLNCSRCYTLEEVARLQRLNHEARAKVADLRARLKELRTLGPYLDSNIMKEVPRE